MKDAAEGSGARIGREAEAEEATSGGVGCAWAMLIFNTLVMGIVAMSFASGPYSSWGQELWYRYGSLAFLASGALLPALVLSSGAHRKPWLPAALVAWMVVTFIGFAYYAVMSGGGV